MCKIYSNLTIKTPERREWRRSGVFIDKFEQILHVVWYRYNLFIINLKLFHTLLYCFYC